LKSAESDRQQHDLVHSVETSVYRSPASGTAPNKTVLVVDDDPVVRDLVVQFLRQRGYAVLQAERATEALRLAATTATVHLLITDLLMPEVDGLELTRRFRAVHPKTPVLMVSGSLPLLPDGSEVGLDRFQFLAKPFLFSELLHKVHSLLDADALAP
jgi:two-component system, cell cycle sensor histidine kinase and response regulator CckA